MVLFLAFSLQDQVEKYGAYVGIAAFFGLAVLSLLYFSQARELKRLRDWAGRAPERAAEVEARVTAQASEVLREQAPVAATAGGARAASSVANGPATAVVETTEAEEAAAAQSGNGTTHAAEVAEHGATSSDPESIVETTEAGEAAQMAAEPEHEPIAPPEEPEAPAEEPEAAEAPDEAEAPAEPAAETPPEAPGEPVAREVPPEAPAVTAGDEAVEVGAAGEAAQTGEQETGEEPEIPASPVPRATPLPRRAPAPAAALRQPTSSATVPPPPQRRPAPARLAESGGDSHATRNGLLAGLGLVAILIGALFATGVLGGSDNTPQAPNRTTESGTATTEPSSSGSGGGSSAEPALTPKSTRVAVLNGTTIGGLASTEADKLRTAGYTGKVTTGNNTDQQRAESSVMYGTRDGARSQARTVARRLDISTVQRMDADTRDLSENADVVVILGQDKAP